MAFHVEIEPQAFDDLDALIEHIKQQSSFETAEKWFRSMLRSIRSLEEMPRDAQLRANPKHWLRKFVFCFMGEKAGPNKSTLQLSTGLRRVAAREFFHVRHWARRTSSANELQDLMDEFAEGEGQAAWIIAMPRFEVGHTSWTKPQPTCLSTALPVQVLVVRLLQETITHGTVI